MILSRFRRKRQLLELVYLNHQSYRRVMAELTSQFLADPAVPFERPLERELGFAVRIGWLGRIVMSCLGNAFDRSMRASYGFISFLVRRTPSGYLPCSRFRVGWWPHHVIRNASCRITFKQFNNAPPHFCSKLAQHRSIGLYLL